MSFGVASALAVINFSQFHSLTASQFHSTGGEGSPFLVSNVSKGYFTLLFGTDKVMYENSKWAQIADVAKKSPPPHARQFPF